jgi:tetratricopeptide (TPR) repeat protein
VRAAGGNPLFIEEMVAIAGGAGSEVSVPPTLQALLAARLDQLKAAERAVLERGAVEGEVFHRGAVQALGPEETQVTRHLAALIRKGLICTVAPQLAGEDGFRFRHILIRDAAYSGLAKATRADLHQRFAAWLKNRGAVFVELDEILGYHLEQAWHYREELKLTADVELAASARRCLAAAGLRAYSRQDFDAAAKLLGRAAALVPQSEVDIPLELNVLFALSWRGDARAVIERSRAIAERAAAVDDQAGVLCGRLAEAMYRMFFETGDVAQVDALANQALSFFEAAGDDFALALAYRALVQVADIRAQMDTLVNAAENAAAHAQKAGFPDQAHVAWSVYGRFHGTMRVSDFLAWQDEQDERDRRNPWNRGYRAGALAMVGRLDEAHALLAELRVELGELGGGLLLAMTCSRVGVEIELLATDPAAAVALGEEGCRLLDELGQRGILATSAVWLAQANYALDRLEDAEVWAGRAVEIEKTEDDAVTQMLWRQVIAKVRARRGELVEAERLAREAIEIGTRTELLNGQAWAFFDLAEVLALGGRREDAAEALEQALDLYERKENLVMAERTRTRLSELRGSLAPAEPAESARAR